jgi:nicotinic acid mononucleotide adenylyltransferase
MIERMGRAAGERIHSAHRAMRNPGPRGPKLAWGGAIVLEQPRFTVHGTLPLLLNRFGGDTISFLIGEDLLSHLTHWPHIGELIENVEFIIGVRKQSEQRIRDTIATIEKMRGHPFRYIIVHTLAKNINSTQIRKDVRGNRELADVHPAVARYIKRNNLYTSQNI